MLGLDEAKDVVADRFRQQQSLFNAVDVLDPVIGTDHQHKAIDAVRKRFPEELGPGEAAWPG